MAIRETIDGIKNLAVGMENLELISKLMDLQTQAYDILDENRQLRLKLEEIERQDELVNDLVYQTEYYFKKSDNSGPYCSVCWDANKLLVHLHGVDVFDGGKGAYCSKCKTKIKILS